MYRRLGWRQVLPAGVATGAFITGLGVFSSLFCSDLVTEGEKSYDQAGVVLGITTYLIGFGVCLDLARSSAACGTTGTGRRRVPSPPRSRSGSPCARACVGLPSRARPRVGPFARRLKPARSHPARHSRLSAGFGFCVPTRSHGRSRCGGREPLRALRYRRAPSRREPRAP